MYYKIHAGAFKSRDASRVERFRHRPGFKHVPFLSGRNNNTKNVFPALQKLRAKYRIPNGFLPLISSTSLTALDHTVRLASSEKTLEYLDEICSSATLAPLRQLHLRIYVASAHTSWICFADVLTRLARLPLHQ